MKVGVIDYGVGNLGSMMRALEELRVAPTLITHPLDMKTVDCLILPGVGSFSDCAQLLHKGNWTEAITYEVQSLRKSLLGICVGMQLLASNGTEGASLQAPLGASGLNLIPGRVEHLRNLGCRLRVPHVGWNAVSVNTVEDSLFKGIPKDTDFYFVHSYAFVPQNPADVLATTDYHMPVVAAIRRDNVWGTQFHPEKSSRAGFRLLRNFIETSAEC